MSACVNKVYKKTNLWDKLPYAGERSLPIPSEPTAFEWPTFYLLRDSNGQFLSPDGEPIVFDIKAPTHIDFAGEQLSNVKKVQRNLSTKQDVIAKFWAVGPPTKKWTPIIDSLITTYDVPAAKAARILSITQAAINDIFVVTWYLKYLWKIARPCQLDYNFRSLVPTPKHPSYPAGHATVSGCAETILSYFFNPEQQRLKQLAEECTISRLWAGVHYEIDGVEGLRLGRQIGQMVVNLEKKEKDCSGARIDKPITKNLHAQLPPPPYVIG